MQYIKLDQIRLRPAFQKQALDKDLVTSLKTKGFLAAHPILLVGKRVYDGNQRVLALRALSPEDLEKALLSWNGLVPCQQIVNKVPAAYRTERAT
jgi:hypothetical protein